MTALGADPEAIRRQADLLDATADDLRGIHLSYPDTGAVCDRTEDGLRLVEQRTATIADRLATEAFHLRSVSLTCVRTDDDVSEAFGPGGG